MTGERWETFRDGFTCSVFEILDSHWLCDEVTSYTTLNSTTSPRSSLSAAERSVGDLEGPQNTAGPAWEEHRRIFGYRPSSGASQTRPGSGNSRGRGRRQPAAFWVLRILRPSKTKT